MLRKLLVVAGIAVILGALLFQPASAVFGRNTFDPEGYIMKNGRTMLVIAQISCTAGERVMIEATLTQEDNGALARGTAHAVCEENDLADETQFQEIPVYVHTRGANTFEPGNVVATGLGVTRDKGRVTGTRQWQPDAGIELVEDDGSAFDQGRPNGWGGWVFPPGLANKHH